MTNNQLFDFLFPVITWIAVFIFVKPRRIVELLPIGIISMLALFLTELFFTSLHVYGYKDPILPIYGISVAWLILALGSGILLGHFLKPVFIKEVLLIAIFSLLARGMDYLELIYGTHFHNSLQWYHNLSQNFVILAFVVWMAEGLYYDRIYRR